MENFTINTDFSSLNAEQADQWMIEFHTMAESAFQESSEQSKLLGNLLIIEQCVHTLRQGLSAEDEKPSAILQHSIDLLWGYVKNHPKPNDFQSFANNLYACTLAYNVGEELTDAQQIFYDEHVGDKELSGIEWQLLTWTAVLLMELMAILGGQVDFSEFESCTTIDFYGVSELLNLLTDAYIDFTNTPLHSSKVKDLQTAIAQVYQTPLFRQLIDNMLTCLKTALSATPNQYSALRCEYVNHTIIPKEFSTSLLEF